MIQDPATTIRILRELLADSREQTREAIRERDEARAEVARLAPHQPTKESTES